MTQKEKGLEDFVSDSRPPQRGTAATKEARVCDPQQLRLLGRRWTIHCALHCQRAAAHRAALRNPRGLRACWAIAVQGRVPLALPPVGMAGGRQGFRRWSSSFSLLTGLQLRPNKLKLELQLWLHQFLEADVTHLTHLTHLTPLTSVAPLPRCVFRGSS